jgi:Na+-driven multidrug efflux pump
MRFTKPIEQLSIVNWTTFDVKDYFFLGIPYFFIQFLDYWAWEQMTIVSGQISLADQVAQVLLLNLLEFNYMFGAGIQTCACTLIGNQIGNGDTKEAKKYLKAVVFVASALFVLQSAALLIWYDTFFYLVNDDPLIAEKAK